MPSCEKCWSDAAGTQDQTATYMGLVKRHGAHCAPEERAGVNALECGKCGRMTLHQHVYVCMVVGCNYRLGDEAESVHAGSS